MRSLPKPNANALLAYRGFLVFSVGVCIAPSARATVYHVSQADKRSSDEGSGTPTRPWKTITHAAGAVKAGDTVLLHTGIYRESIEVKASGTPQKPIRFVAAPGEQVILTGADRLTKWQKADPSRPIYRADWPYRFITWNKSMAHPDDDRHAVIGRSEQVFVDGYLMQQVSSRDRLAPGTFFADTEEKMLYVWGTGNENLVETSVEASARDTIFTATGANIQLRGIRFRYAANHAQQGAVILGGDRDVMEDCIVEATNASGAAFIGKDIVVRRCIFRDNGQLGFGAAGAHRLLFTGCRVENNNVKNFSRGWEAGGDKLVMSRDVVLEKSTFCRNRGVGIWFDIGNENATVRNCLIQDNEDAGIFYEISYGLHANDNVIIGNGFATTQGAWGAQGGIVLSSSPDAVIQRNLIVGNREGFNFREQGRTTPRIDGGDNQKEVAVWNHDTIIRNNLFAFNQDAQVRGWFDVNDERMWPRGSRGVSSAGNSAKPGDLSAAYGAKDQTVLPKDLYLEKLNIRFDNNRYYSGPGQGLLRWGVEWKRNEAYPTPEAFGKALGIDRGGQLWTPNFADIYTLDFRVPSETMKSIRGSYPVGAVPGVKLGTLPQGRKSAAR